MSRINPTLEIGHSFNQHAAEYAHSAKIQEEIGNRLIERLDYLTLKPRFILDLGCGPASFLTALKKKYPKALVVGIDIAFQMLLMAKKKYRFWQKSSLVNGDMNFLPFKEDSFDLIFANQVVHWSSPLANLLQGLNRVLAPEGCLFFSTLGPDTFKEFKQAWAFSASAHTNDFLDMHDIGDALLRIFADPVVDMEMISMHYKTVPALVQSLKKQGVRNINPRRAIGLTGKKDWELFYQSYEKLRTSDNHYPLTYEVIYGHGWKKKPVSASANIEHAIPLSAIKVKNNLKLKE